MASIVKEVTTGSGSYGPWHEFYKRQLEASNVSSGMNDPRTAIPTFTPEPAAKPTQSTQTDNPVGSAEDPDMAYNNFYQRLLSGGSEMEQTHMVGQSLSPHRFADPGPPTVRAGRLGAPWRHVRQCTGNGGNHICFIDGMVKENDMNQYPPYGFSSPRPVVLDQSAGSRHLSAPMPALARSMPAGTTRYNNSFNNHAKNGFKYWFEEKKGLPAKQTIGGRLMKMGVGY